MMIRALLLSVVVSVAPVSVWSEGSSNHYLDPKTNAEWLSILGENKQNNDVAKLFTLRIELCELVARNVISIKRATSIFKEERDRVVVEKKNQRDIALRRKLPKS